MLIKFTSSTSGQMIMFAENARELFKIMDKPCMEKGVFEHERLEAALTKLKHAADTDKARPVAVTAVKKQDEEKHDTDEKTQDEPVSLHQRAQPLIRLMERTLKTGGFILWEASGPF